MNALLWRMVIGALASAPAVAVGQEFGQPYELTAPENNAVVSAVNAATGRASKAKVTDVYAARDGQEAAMVCGHVSAIDGSGGYGQERAFVVHLGEASTTPVLAQVVMIAASAAEQSAVELVCASSGVTGFPIAEETRSLLAKMNRDLAD